MSNNSVHIVGFGSQGSAWAQCLQASGWQVQTYLSKKGPSFQRAIDAGFQPLLLQDLPPQISDRSKKHWVALLTPDSAIPAIYGDFIAPVSSQVRLILAHGYAIYSGELKLRHPEHQATLFAPKAIGP